MFGLFKKKNKVKLPPTIFDMNGNPIAVGDTVKSHRYELGLCTVQLEGLEYFYESKESGKRSSYTRMVDAITGHQKVNKLD